MGKVLTDVEIADLLSKQKPLPRGWRARLRLIQRRGDAHRRRDMPIEAATGERFVIKCRQRNSNPLDFSIVLVYLDDASNEYRLLRCNGRHESEHTNQLEKWEGAADHTFLMRFHVHRATQRYQEAGFDIDHFADPTDAYSDYDAALEHFVRMSGCTDPDGEPDGPLLGMMGDAQ
jgi:hypothetical protein